MPNQPAQNTNPKQGNTLEDLLYKQGLLSSEQLSAIKLETINSGKNSESIILDHNLVPPEKISRQRLNF